MSFGICDGRGCDHQGNGAFELRPAGASKHDNSGGNTHWEESSSFWANCDDLFDGIERHLAVAIVLLACDEQPQNAPRRERRIYARRRTLMSNRRTRPYKRVTKLPDFTGGKFVIDRACSLEAAMLSGKPFGEPGIRHA